MAPVLWPTSIASNPRNLEADRWHDEGTEKKQQQTASGRQQEWLDIDSPASLLLAQYPRPLSGSWPDYQPRLPFSDMGHKTITTWIAASPGQTHADLVR
jgi:hypothetical protein